jgi:hypothetical protein
MSRTTFKPESNDPLLVKFRPHVRSFLDQVRREEFRSSIGDAARALIDRAMAQRNGGNTTNNNNGGDNRS